MAITSLLKSPRKAWGCLVMSKEKGVSERWCRKDGQTVVSQEHCHGMDMWWPRRSAEMTVQRTMYRYF